MRILSLVGFVCSMLLLDAAPSWADDEPLPVGIEILSNQWSAYTEVTPPPVQNQYVGPDGDLVTAEAGATKASMGRTRTVTLTPDGLMLTVTYQLDCRGEVPDDGFLEDGYARAEGGASVRFWIGSRGTFQLFGSLHGSPAHVEGTFARNQSEVRFGNILQDPLVQETANNPQFHLGENVPFSGDGTLAPGEYEVSLTCRAEAPRQFTNPRSFDGPVGEAGGDFSFSVTVTNEEVAWINAAGGAYGTAANWDPAGVPVASDRVRFELAAVYGVQLGGSRTLTQALVRASLLDLLGGTLTLTGGGAPGLAIGNGARLTLAGATVQPAGVAIGDVALGPPSALVVPASGVLTATGITRVGDAATGVLDVTGGDATLGATTVGGPEEGGGQALTRRATGPLPGTPAADTLPEQSGGKIRVNGGGGATFASLAVGGSGPGFVDVRQGSLLRVLGEARVGVVPGPGFVVVEGAAGDAFTIWQSDGPLLVGTNAEATFDVLSGGRVTAPSLELGVEGAGDGALTVAGLESEVTVAGRLSVGVEGIGSLTVTRGTVRANELRAARSSDAEATIRVQSGHLSAEDTMAIGIPGPARLEITDGRVRARVLTVAAFAPNVPSLTPSVVEMAGGFLTVTDAVVIGNLDEATGTAGTLGLVDVQGGGRLEVTAVQGLVSVDNGELVVTGTDFGVPSLLHVAQLELLSGTVAVRDGARAEIDEGYITGAPLADPVLEVRDATVQVATALDVGDASDATRRGRVQLAGTALVAVGRELLVGPGGVIAGTGRIRVGAVDVEPAGGTLTNLGLISAGSSPGAIAIEGDLIVGSAGTLVVEVGGTAPGAFDVVTVMGNVKLGGTLVLRFLDGYLPQPGDAFPFLTGKKVKGAFDAVRVENVGPGFDFALAPTAGALAVTALSAATPPPCRDPADEDGDGATCTDNCRALANVDQVDADFDGIGDACDTCADGAPLAKPVLTLKKGKLALKGTLSIPGAPLLQPAITGARVTLEDGAGAIVATFDAPPGIFDAASESGWKKFAYASRTGALRALKLGQAKKKPGTIKLDVKVVLSGVDPATLALPLTARISLAPASVPTTLCGQVAFTGPAGVHPLCELKKNALGCKAQKQR